MTRSSAESACLFCLLLCFSVLALSWASHAHLLLAVENDEMQQEVFGPSYPNDQVEHLYLINS